MRTRRTSNIFSLITNIDFGENGSVSDHLKFLYWSYYVELSAFPAESQFETY